MTDKIKAIFFAQYLYQDVVCVKHDPRPFPLTQIQQGTDEYLLLRSINDLTDEECNQIAKIAHQMPKATFKVFSRDKDLIHVEHKSSIGITHHISILTKYATVNANVHFSKTDTEEFTSYKHNIGEITMSSKYPVPYLAITDYLRAKGFATQFTFLNDQNQPETYSVEKLVELGWLMIKTNN